ncbi:hypothetical protein F5J12DRAFT_862663 [Pisolithus orientalis]|uniref:uncharacterized protein n=1 Tax=Pisolithus orientalis TaxID=936130 RepID=UPI0022240CAE|nr:uncharacterized protein F5J12DRAFT_862663 [Pisolithus orientalis]KAI5990534.1 hypothetical protein F5J12DRAFT_862663 [Pisolithus orientalis]
MASADDTEEMLRLAAQGFDLLFANDLEAAVNVFVAESQENSPFHLVGLGVCAFLKAALGMEVRPVHIISLTNANLHSTLPL